MLPLFKDVLHVGLFADRIVLVREGGGLGTRSQLQTSVPLDPGSSVDAMLDVLQEQLKDARWHNAQAYVQLSGVLVSYTIVQASQQPLSAAEELALAQLKLRQMHGSVAGEREVRLANPLQGQDQIAAALESSFVKRLQELLAGAKLRLRSMQPLLMHAFNRMRHQMESVDYWFALAEPGLLTLARWQGGWRSLSAITLDGALEEALPMRLQQARLMSSASSDSNRVYLYSPGVDSRACGSSEDLELITLKDLHFPDPLAAALDASLAIEPALED